MTITPNPSPDEPPLAPEPAPDPGPIVPSPGPGERDPGIIDPEPVGPGGDPDPTPSEPDPTPDPDSLGLSERDAQQGQVDQELAGPVGQTG